jgi:hypothetical protein
MPRIALALVPLAVLTACGQEPAQQTPDQAAQAAEAAAASAPRPEPGKYKVTMKVNSITFPGMTGQMAEKAKGMFGGTGQASEFCLTPEDAKKGQEEFYKRTAEGNCKYEKFSATGGAIDAVMVCQTGKGMSARTELKGTFSSTRSDLTMKTQSQVPGAPGGGMNMDAQVTSERIGDCA